MPDVWWRRSSRRKERPVARNAWFGVALLALTSVAACGGEAVEAKAAEAAQAQLAMVRARTDSIKQAREPRLAAAAADTAARSDSTGADSTAQSSMAATPGTTSADSVTVGGHPAAKATAVKPAADSLDQDAEEALADSVQQAREIEVMRETFAYAGGTRDPFASLIDLRNSGPEVADLDLVGVYWTFGPRPTTSSCCGRRAPAPSATRCALVISWAGRG